MIPITGDLGDSYGHGPALFLSAPISLKVTHQGKGWAPALPRLSPSTLGEGFALEMPFGLSGTLMALPQWDSGPSWSWDPHI